MSVRAGLLFLALFACLAAPLRAQPLVAELGRGRVEITTAFAGDSVLVFGAFDPPGDVVVVVRGQPRPTTVRRKVSVAGIWINGPSARFASLPSFYAVGGTRPVWEAMDTAERRGATVGLDTVAMLSRGSQDPSFRDALIRIRDTQGLYNGRIEVHVIGGRLFRAQIPVPALIEPGDYLIDVMLVREGRIAARQELGLAVVRTGFAADVNRVAHEQPALYGLACIAIAAFAGWAGAILFRRS